MLEMFTVGQPVDFVTVLEKLKESPSFEEAQGRTYLVQLAQMVPSISNVESYARIVRDKYDIRTLILTAEGDSGGGRGWFGGRRRPARFRRTENI